MNQQQEMDWRKAREEMILNQLLDRGIVDTRVLAAFGKVRRHDFVPGKHRRFAYTDQPLPIGFDQTISQPYMVATMLQLAGIRPGDRVLEIGTGSGYQTALLAEMAAEVYSIEIVEELGLQTRRLLHRLGYTNVHIRIGDGYAGWREEAPFDAIIVAAAAPYVPAPLTEQLAENRRLIIPVGRTNEPQRLLRITKSNGKLISQSLMTVRFVPFVRN